MRVISSKRVPVDVDRVEPAGSSNNSEVRRYIVTVAKFEQQFSAQDKTTLKVRYLPTLFEDSTTTTYDLALENLDYSISKHVPGRSAVDFHVTLIDGYLTISRRDLGDWEHYRMTKHLFHYKVQRYELDEKYLAEDVSAEDWEVMLETLEVGLLIWELINGEDAAVFKEEDLRLDSAEGSQRREGGGSEGIWDGPRIQ